MSGHDHSPEIETKSRSLLCAVDIVAAYLGHNALRASDIPDLISSVHSTVANLMDTQTAPEAQTMSAEPAVAIKKSVTNDYIVCLEDGKKFKSLRRHLNSFHGMTPDAYRMKWNLNGNYPMVAPAYSAKRSQLAKDSGLGLVTKDIPEANPTVAVKKPGRGRPRKIT